MTVINTNVASLYAQQAIAANSNNLSKAMQQLSTGKRINLPSDDAAGNAIVNNMTSQIAGLNQAVRNANDGISMLQTAQGATNEVATILQRMRELAVQSANGTYGSSDRTGLDAENTQLKNELSRIASVTKWNNIALLPAGGSGLNVSFQVGYGSASANQVSVSFSGSITASGLGISSALTSVSGATSLIGQIDTAMGTLNKIQGSLGSVSNRLQLTADELTNTSTNLSQSQSRIQDTDYGQATAQLARAQVIQQAATAMLAQANQQPQLVLALLK